MRTQSQKLTKVLSSGKLEDITHLTPTDPNSSDVEYVPDYSEHIAKGWRVYKFTPNDTTDGCVWQAVKNVMSFVTMIYSTLD